MLFNSFEYLFVFLPAGVICYFLLNRFGLNKTSNIWLVFLNILFYSWWNIANLPLLLFSILANYYISIAIINYNSIDISYITKRALLLLGIFTNISILCYYKYYDFFVTNTNHLFSSDFQVLRLALPLAISFYTLQQIAYLVDCYEGLVKRSSLVDYTLFVTFFPQLIAGPIVHHKEMIPQFETYKNKVANYNKLLLGFFFISVGLFKKAVIADNLDPWVAYGYDNANSINLYDGWITSLSYTFQLYFDFSGYTDIAIGSALLFNIYLPNNFNSPYKSSSLIEFWQRWHISLSKFITTYIYSPIIRSYSTPTFAVAMSATIITFFIAGLWHGSTWMFVIFGLLHGFGIVLNQYWKKYGFKLNRIFAWLLTFNYINITLIFFRSDSLGDAVNILNGMFSTNLLLPESIFKLYIIILLFCIILICNNTYNLIINANINIHTIFYYSFIMYTSIIIMSMGRSSAFLYYDF
jgi:alginate O-acetyltransferase complex protein AlgI